MVSTSLPGIFLFITRAVTFKLLFQIITGYYFGFGFALCKNYPQMLPVIRVTLYGVGRARLIVQIGFCVVNFAGAHNVIYIVLANPPAIHTAACMLSIF